jgi:hypothetical protein
MLREEHEECCSGEGDILIRLVRDGLPQKAVCEQTTQETGE